MLDNSVSSLLLELWHALTVKQRQSVVRLLLLSVLCGLLEVLMLAVAAPFFSMLTGNTASRQMLPVWLHELSAVSPVQIALLFLAVSLLAAIARLALLFLTNRIGFRIGADVGLLVFRQALLEPLEIQKARSSAEVIAASSEKSHVMVYSVIVAALQFFGSSIVFFSIGMALCLLNPWITVGTVVFFSGLYLAIVFWFRESIARASDEAASYQTAVFRTLQEGLGSKREVILHKAHTHYCDLYQRAAVPLRAAQGRIQFAIQGPRFIIESAVVLSIGGIFLVLSFVSESVTATLPLLGVFALGGLKLLPVTQQIYASSTAIVSSRATMEDVLYRLRGHSSVSECSRAARGTLRFESGILLDRVSFSYQGSSGEVLRDISMEIRKGERIVVSGPSGSGKSTLGDLLLGLLTPTRGTILVDDVHLQADNTDQWHALVAHVPQDLFLADASIAENIAGAVPKHTIDMAQVRRAASLAQISDLVQTLPGGYDFVVGEGGGRLSGGQRQRVAIARAFYRGAKFLLLDEATSALDSELERELMTTIHAISRDITIVVITHNLEVTREFDRAYRLVDGVLTPADWFAASDRA